MIGQVVLMSSKSIMDIYEVKDGAYQSSKLRQESASGTKKIRRGLSTKARTIVQSSQRADFVRNSRVYNLSPTKIHDGMKVPMTTPISAPVLFWSPSGGTGN